ncbi:MAG TPA: TIM barrel protein [archaeon]|nr:TIM barrel protein [archaeon]
MQILLGPAGTPGKNTLDGLSATKKLGLQAMEVQFTHGIAMGLELAKKIGEENKKYEVALSIHAPYFINLASEDKKKIEASKKRIIDSCERGHLMGAERVVFHPGYYGQRSKEETYEMIKDAIEEMQKTIKENKWRVSLAPETSGKHSAFGTLDEIINIAKEAKCSLCTDIAHLYAKGMGRIDYDEVFEEIRKIKEKNYHFHFSNIKYSEKGELSHLVLDEKPDFAVFAESILRSKIGCTIISESPITWKDSLKMKNIFEKRGYKF